MKIETYSLSHSELEAFANQVKDALMEYLGHGGGLEKEDAEDMMLTHQIVIKCPSAVCRLYHRILGKEKADVPRIVVARHHRLDGQQERPKTDEPEPLS